MNAAMDAQRRLVTGLVLAGGRAQRMGGVDKGLQPFEGQPLAARALARLAAQVGPLMLSANRHLETYEAFGVPVCADEEAAFHGPLAGLAAGLSRCATPWLACVPCDAPHFPVDLVARLLEAAATRERQGAPVDVAVARSPQGLQPIFCLVRSHLAAPLAVWLSAGGRRVSAWMLAQRHVEASFDDAAAFANANTFEELRALQSMPAGIGHG